MARLSFVPQFPPRIPLLGTRLYGSNPKEELSSSATSASTLPETPWSRNAATSTVGHVYTKYPHPRRSNLLMYSGYHLLASPQIRLVQLASLVARFHPSSLYTDEGLHLRRDHPLLPQNLPLPPRKFQER